MRATKAKRVKFVQSSVDEYPGFLGNVSQLYTNLLMLERSIHLGKTMEKLKHPLQNLCYFTARLRHLDQHFHVHRRAKPRQYEVINQSNFLLHMSTTVYWEKERQNAPFHRHQANLNLRGSKRAKRDQFDRCCLILMRDNANTPAASARSKTP